jgi:hypothetical protein
VTDEVGDVDALVDDEDWEVGIGVSRSVVVNEEVEVEVDVEVSRSSVSDGEVEVSGSSVVGEVVVVVVDRTGVKVSAGLVEVRVIVMVVCDGVALLLVVEVGASEEVPEQTKSTRFPDNAPPNTDAGSTSTSGQAACRVYWILLRPFTHAAEHVFPNVKSSIVQPGI